MKRAIIIFLVLVTISCNQKTVTPITFSSRDYEFNEEISNTLKQSGEVGFSATRFSFVSEHKKLLESLEYGDTVKHIMTNSEWGRLEISDNHLNAKDYIVSKAKEHDIIMFNENHFLPRHRNFVRSLLPDLYELGYRYLAIEAIGMLGDGSMYDKDLIARGYPIIHTGHYIKEPEFSMLIRTAIEHKYSIIGYDEGSSYGYSGGEREERGANNILSQMELDGNQGKLIVLCGWDHLKEGKSGTYWEYALAERLKQKTNKDPLTINQTEYNERLNRGYEKSLMQKIETDESIVLTKIDKQPLDLSTDTSWYDAFVIHPRTKFKVGMPNWILEEGPIKKYNLSDLDIMLPAKILVFDSKDDVSLASPIYVCEVSDNKEKIIIPTRGKKIKLVVTNKKESVLIE